MYDHGWAEKWDEKFVRLENHMLNAMQETRWDVQQGRPVPEHRLTLMQTTAKAIADMAARYEEARKRAEAEYEKEYE